MDLGAFGFGSGLGYYLFGVAVMVAITAPGQYAPSRQFSSQMVAEVVVWALFWPFAVLLMAGTAVVEHRKERKFVKQRDRGRRESARHVQDRAELDARVDAAGKAARAKWEAELSPDDRVRWERIKARKAAEEHEAQAPPPPPDVEPPF